MTADVAPLLRELPIENLKRSGLRLPQASERGGIYCVFFDDGTCYPGQTANIIHRIGAHRRTWDDICRVQFTDAAEGARFAWLAQVRDRMGCTVRQSRSRFEIDPFPGWIRWREMHLSPDDPERPAEVPQQREWTRPKFDRLVALPDADRVIALVRSFIRRLVPDAAATERVNWVVTSMPSTAKTTLWHRLVCVSVNNVEVLTIGHQLDAGRWTVMGFISANPVLNQSDLLSDDLIRAGAFVAPARYATVGDVAQVGFDTLDALYLLLEDDRVLDAAEGMVLRLMQRGRGLYGRYHDYNLADLILEVPDRRA